MNKHLRFLLAALLCVFAGSAGFAAQTETIFLWQSDGSTTALETDMTATGGTAAFYVNAPSTESAAYDASVTDSELKATGAKAHKLGKNAAYLKITLSSGYFKAGDVISICGYNPFRVGTETTSDDRASTDIAESLATGGDKNSYMVGTVKIPSTIGDEVNTIYISRANGSGTGLAAVKITRTNAAADEPVLTATPASLMLNLGMGESTISKTFNIAGENLEDGTYSFVVPSALAVSPASVTVEDGVLDEDITVTFESSEAVASSEGDISLTIGELTATVAVTYSAAGSLSEVELDKIWNFSDSQWADYASTETIIDNLHLAKSMAYDGNEKSIDGFKFYKRLKLNGTGSASQRYVHFKVPGDCKITVYGMSGSNGAARSINIDTEEFGSTAMSWENDGTAIGKAVYDYEGDATDVWIYSTNSGFNLYAILVQAPTPETVTVNIGSAGAASFSSRYALDFTNSEVKAYIVKGRDDNGSFTKHLVTEVPANTGIIVEATQGQYEIPTIESAEAISGNKLVATAWQPYTVNTSDEGLVYGLFKSASTGKVGFQKKKADFTFGIEKCYLRMPAESSAKGFEEFFFDDTTGIENAMFNVQSSKNEVYNLNGQRVDNNYKGVVIVNGKKAIKK